MKTANTPPNRQRLWLIAKTRRGEARLGGATEAEALILQTAGKVHFSDKPGPWLLCAREDCKRMFWVHRHADDDFTIIENRQNG